MRTIDHTRLESDELVFCLETNGVVDASLFVRLIECLANMHDGDLIPTYTTDIVELSTGSLFGRLRLNFSRSNFTDDRIDRLEASVSEMRRLLDAQGERQTIAVERSAVAAERSVAEQRDGNRSQRYVVGLTAAALVLTFWQSATKIPDSECAGALSALIDKDGISSFDLWCRDQHIRIHGHDVARTPPAEEGDTMRAEGLVAGVPTLESPTFTQSAAAQTATPSLSGKALGPLEVIDMMSEQPRVIPLDPAIVLGPPFDAVASSELARYLGTIVTSNGVMTLNPNPFPRALDPIVLVSSQPIEKTGNWQYEVIGDLYRAKGRPVMIHVRSLRAINNPAIRQR